MTHAHEMLQAKRYRKLLSIIILSLTVLSLMFLIALQIQTLLMSYHTTRQTMQARFYPIKEVPTWHIVTSNE